MLRITWNSGMRSDDPGNICDITTSISNAVDPLKRKRAKA